MATGGVVRLRRLRPNEPVDIDLDFIKEEEVEQEEKHIADDEELNEETPPKADEETIQKNLEKIKYYTKNKVQAQKVFYQKLGNFNEERGPVRQRLGGTVKLRRLKPVGSTTPGVTHTNVLRRRPPTGNGSIATNWNARRRYTARRLNGTKRTNTAQARIDRIRNQNRFELIYAQQPNNGVVRLRRAQNPVGRVLPRGLSHNLIVSVDNTTPSVRGQTHPNPVERFKLTLDPEIQGSIRILQQQGTFSPEPVYADDRARPETTAISLSMRFTQLT